MVEKNQEQPVGDGVDPEGSHTLLKQQSSLAANEEELAKQQEELKKLEQELEESK